MNKNQKILNIILLTASISLLIVNTYIYIFEKGETKDFIFRLIGNILTISIFALNLYKLKKEKQKITIDVK
ncbi:DUF3087 family protein [Flavobacterium sp. GA093]|uniref:DUF3087 family protein n=1 Tax=Flavobacterium hydrocarbonoxydans TaxID=2683249 RepID=A0A6I4NRP7_9FLAO|nr:DUF3087 family protein [Flavobacterium hydrocarbonoxydans]MWB96893.1 DUF3087 family protein [Flavobacterium hydrocarbonoxydans]